MMEHRNTIYLFLAVLISCSCSKSHPQHVGSKLGSNTHWLSCGTGTECEEEDDVCVCGICTSICSTDADCADRDGICVAAGDGEAYNAGKISGATGCVTSSLGMILLGVEDVEPKACLPGCKDDSDCESLYYCDSGACVPGVGTPCIPTIIPSSTKNGVTEKGFSATEAYFEFSTPKCATGVCVVHRLAGDPSPDCEENCADPDWIPLKAHCTCRCDGPANAAGNFCDCPDGFSCIETIETGPSQGSYCINNETFYYEDRMIRWR